MPVPHPENLLKPKEYLRQTLSSVGKVHQPKITLNVNIPTEELTLKENFKQVYYAEASTSKRKIKLETPEVNIPEIKFEIDQTIPVSLIDTFTSDNKGSISIPTIINTLSIISPPEVKKNFSPKP
jgi:hypothetical protein